MEAGTFEPGTQSINTDTKFGGNLFNGAALFGNHFDSARLEGLIVARRHCSFFDWHGIILLGNIGFLYLHSIIPLFFLSINSGIGALVAKADKSYVDSALWDKADGAAVYEELDKKANQTDVTALENDLDTFYTDLNNLQSTAVTDAPSDGNTYARKDGAWTNLTRQIGKQLINFVPLEYDGSDVTDLDNLPSGITIVDYADGPGYGGYMVMTSLEGSGYGYQIKISIEGLSYRYNNGTWGAWIKIG